MLCGNLRGLTASFILKPEKLTANLCGNWRGLWSSENLRGSTESVVWKIERAEGKFSLET